MTKLGTAQIAKADLTGWIVLTWLPVGNCLRGREIYEDNRQGWNAALRFCRLNGLRVQMS